jgi:cell division protein FtsN
MEQFNQQENRSVKEKSVYLLHLDGPRILILSALIIGFITVAVLVGMKISEGGNGSEILAQNDSLMESQNTLPGGMDTTDPTKDPLLDLQSAQPGSQQQPGLEQTPGQKGLSSPLVATDPKKSEKDLLAGDQPVNVVPSVPDSQKPVKKHHIAKKHDKKKQHVVRRKNKDEVVEVSDVKVKGETKDAHGFFIQLASYDRSDPAKKEVTKLKEMEYDAYFDKAKIKGKNFYRVRIGPIESKDAASQMLDEIQTDPRYEDSFLVQE